MTQGLADTSTYIALEQGRPMAAEPPHVLLVSYFTVAELALGVRAAKTPVEHDLRAATLKEACGHGPLPVDLAVAEAWSWLQMELRRTNRGLDGNDCWIAATALAHGLPVVTQDADFAGVPGLDVIRV